MPQPTRSKLARSLPIAAAALLALAAFALSSAAGTAQPDPEGPQDADAILAELRARETLGPRAEEAEEEMSLLLRALDGDVPLRVALLGDEKPESEGAADGRTDTKSKRILLVHGRDSYNMNGFASMRSYLINTYGFTGGVDRVGYYGGECNVEQRAEHHGSHDVHYGGAGEHSAKTGCIGGNNQVHDLGTDIRHIAYHVAWMIYDHWSASNVVIDYDGHSMGGLLIRYALAKEGTSGWPSKVLVEDVNTIGTPHGGLGTSWCHWQPWQDVEQMCSDSSFMTWLDANAQNPQANGWSTDWTLMGSDCDGWVAWNLAVDMTAAHKVVYMSPCYGHSEYYGDTSGVGDADVDYMDSPATTWTTWLNAPHAVRWTAHASYYGSW